MAIGEIRLGDKGYIFEITVKDQDNVAVDLSGTTTKQFVFRKPDGTAKTEDASFVTDGTDGKIKWYTQATDLDVVGDWQFQVYLQWTANDFRSDIHNFMVHPNLPTS